MNPKLILAVIEFKFRDELLVFVGSKCVAVEMEDI